MTAPRAALPIDDRDLLAFLDPRVMAANTQALLLAVQHGEGSLLGLAAGPPAEQGFLDLRRVVVIAATHGQEAHVLDDSSGEEPRVLSTHDQSAAPKWVEVARTFDEFLRLLNVPSPG